jgi:hypothetical protein
LPPGPAPGSWDSEIFNAPGSAGLEDVLQELL